MKSKKIVGKEEYDESFSAKEIGLIDGLIDVSIKKHLLGKEADLDKALR